MTSESLISIIYRLTSSTKGKYCVFSSKFKIKIKLIKKNISSLLSSMISVYIVIIWDTSICNFPETRSSYYHEQKQRNQCGCSGEEWSHIKESLTVTIYYPIVQSFSIVNLYHIFHFKSFLYIQHCIVPFFKLSSVYAEKSLAL